MLKVEVKPPPQLTFFYDCYAILAGGLLISIASFIKLPFYPVSFTAHTLVIFFLALIQTPKQAFGSVIFFLGCGSLGLPVFSGNINPLWMFGAKAGYYISFPFAAYVIAHLREEYSDFTSICIGQAIIYLFGFIGLSTFIGNEAAFIHGVLIFIPLAFLKNYLAQKMALRWNEGKRP